MIEARCRLLSRVRHTSDRTIPTRLLMKTQTNRISLFNSMPYKAGSPFRALDMPSRSGRAGDISGKIVDTSLPPTMDLQGTLLAAAALISFFYVLKWIYWWALAACRLGTVPDGVATDGFVDWKQQALSGLGRRHSDRRRNSAHHVAAAGQVGSDCVGFSIPCKCPSLVEDCPSFTSPAWI